jgi:nitrite reductase (NADH) large subunit
LEKSKKESPPANKFRLVVVGNGMAGVAAAEEVLSLRSDVSITIFGDEPHPNYNRILLSDVLAGKQSKEGILLNPLDWYSKRGIDLRLGVRVRAIHPLEKQVTDDHGRATPYDRLLLATGGRPFIPPIAGMERPGVFVFRTLDDCDAILERCRTDKEAVVIGGGLLGLEAARALINHGVGVTVVHLTDRLMERQLDPIGGALLKREIERLGITVLLDASASEIFGSGGSIEGVRLKDGRTLPAGMVLVCAGYRPCVDLARAAGLSADRGVAVNDRMQTSDPNIFAVGDVAEHRGKVYGLVAPIRDQARVFADAVAGKGTLRYEGTTFATVLKVAGVNLTSAGDFLGGVENEELVYLDTQAGVYKKLVVRRNRIAGIILLGDNKEGQRLFNLLKSGEDISASKDRLITQGSTVVDPSIVGTAALSDADLVCNCHTITKGAILTAIREKGLTNRAEVAAATKASTGCGSCASLVEDLLTEASAKGRVSGVGDNRKQELRAGTQELGVDFKDRLPVPDTRHPSPISIGIPLAYPRVFDAERIKQEGLDLNWEMIRERGALALTQDDYYRLKSYGVCSQKHTGYFMVRVRIPGGKVDWRSLLTLADLAETHGRGRAHLTTRQDLELHWVRLEEVPEIWRKLEEVGLSTRSACGHTLRNVACCPHSTISPDGLIDVHPLARAVSDYFIGRSDLINPTMPNRLNVYFAGCARCAAEARINDIGFVSVKRTENGKDQIGFELWAGGSLGSHPILGYRLRDFLHPEEVLAACQAIFLLHTRYGNRGKGKSRLKYLVERWGREKFSEQFEKIFHEKRVLPESREFRRTILTSGTGGSARRERSFHSIRGLFSRPDRIGIDAGDIHELPLQAGVFPQRQKGYLWLAADIPMGEVHAEQLRAIARACRRYGNGEAYFTKEQDVELHWVRRRKLKEARFALERAGLLMKGEGRLPRVVACPGTEFCVLAVTNAQGAAKEILGGLRSDDPARKALLSGLSIHISGCPNSCAKHQVADIGLAGSMSAVGEDRRFSYFLYLGGSAEGEVRLGEVVRKGITEEMVLPTLDALLSVASADRKEGESFRSVVERVGGKEIGRRLEERLAPYLPRAASRVSLVLDADEETEDQEVT